MWKALQLSVHIPICITIMFSGKGYFMHLSTAVGIEGDKALLESRILYPKRGFQCLQFFLYNSGHASDQLRIWTREFDMANPNGTLHLIQQIEGTNVQP